MADADAAAGRSDGPPPPSQALSLCADLQSKLMMLGYESEYCAPNDTAPFPPTYFAAPSAKPGIQFRHFIGLASYLGEKTGARDLAGGQYGDPNAAVNTLSSNLHSMGFVADFPPIKLKPGCGEPVCRVLNFLSDAALKSVRFSFQAPRYPEALLPDASSGDQAGSEHVDEGDDDDEIDDDTEAVAAAAAGQAAEEEALYTEAHASSSSSSSSAAAAAAAEEERQSKVDVAAWQAEVERMSARLRSRPAASGREWRGHLEQTARHNATITALLGEAGRSLSAVNADVSTALQRLADKERFLNATLTALLEEHSKARAKADELRGEHGQRTSAVAALSTQVGEVGDELDEAKTRMDEHGSSMTDQSPLVRVKTALAKLRAESKALDLRIGVTGHGVMQRKLQAATNQATGGGDDGDEWVAEDDLA